jgi:hypothetical protein
MTAEVLDSSSRKHIMHVEHVCIAIRTGESWPTRRDCEDGNARNMLRMIAVMLLECPCKETIEDTIVGTDMPGNDRILERVSIEASIGSWIADTVFVQGRMHRLL